MKKLLTWGACLLATLLFSAFLLSYCSIYFYPKADVMQEITPHHKYEQMVITDETAPTNSCHASTLAFFKDELYCAWFGGTHEGHPDVTIYLSKRNDGEWSAPTDMSDIQDVAHYNPVLFAYQDTLYLYYKIGTAPSNWVTYYRATQDGVHWSEEEKLVEGDEKGRGPVKNKPIVLSDHTVLAPASYEYTNWFPKSFVDISTDMKTWTESGGIHSSIAIMPIQPTLIELESGHVVAYLRTNARRIFRSDSFDFGKTWSRPTATPLLNNNSGIDGVKMQDGTIAIVHNPVGEDWGARSPLVVGLSYDGGDHFTEQIVLENTSGEFSYPAVITKDNVLYISYTYNRKFIKYVEIKL